MPVLSKKKKKEEAGSLSLVWLNKNNKGACHAKSLGFGHEIGNTFYDKMFSIWKNLGLSKDRLTTGLPNANGNYSFTERCTGQITNLCKMS